MLQGMRHRGHALIRTGAPGLLLFALLASGALAQEPHVDPTHGALNWIIGRWYMPVTCEREDGSRVQIEDAIVLRPATEDPAGRSLKATFFGLDIADAKRCFTMIDSNVRDRRGVLYLTYTSQRRTDLGLKDLRDDLEDGELTYQITRGKLRERNIASGDPPRVLHYTSKDGRLTVKELKRGSDGYKLLSTAAPAQPAQGLAVRWLSLELTGREMDPVKAYILEDAERRPGR